MKKVCFSLILSITAYQALAQFGQNATWHFSYSEYNFFGHKKVQHVSDTIIHGMTWQKLEVTGSRGAWYGPGSNDYSLSTGITFDPIYIATRNDSVFRLGTDSALLLYDLNADIGDEWEFAQPDTSFGCTAPSTATVVAKGVENIGGANSVRYIDVRFPMDTVFYPNDPHYQIVSPYYLSARIYLDFGALFYNGLFAPSPNTCDGTSFQLNMYTLRCFQNDSISFNLTQLPCNTNIGELEFLNDEVMIYPNPSGGRFFIQIPRGTMGDGVIQISSISGKIVETLPIQNEEEHTFYLDTPGVYTIQVISPRKGVKFTSKVVISE